MRALAALLLLLAAMGFALGITLPVMRFERLLVFEDTPSILAIIATLFDDGAWALAALVSAVSVVFPLVKLATVFVHAVDPGRDERWLRHMGLLSKWSMADVLVVALVIVAAKTSGLADAAALPGIWFYGGSALAGAAAAALLRRGRRATPQLGRAEPGS